MNSEPAITVTDSTRPETPNQQYNSIQNDILSTLQTAPSLTVVVQISSCGLRVLVRQNCGLSVLVRQKTSNQWDPNSPNPPFERRLCPARVARLPPAVVRPRRGPRASRRSPAPHGQSRPRSVEGVGDGGNGG